MKIYDYILSATILLVSICGCARKSAVATAADECEPLFLTVRPLPEGGYSLISLSPFDGSRDTLIISRPLSRLIVMSTSHIGFLRAIGGEDAIVGVSGAEYVYDSTVRARIGEGRILDIGYDASPDYEKIMALKPELVLTYSVSPVKSQFLTKLESLGISTFTVNEHLESHPLARASYVRLFGALTGNMSAADSVLKVVSENYINLRDSVQSNLNRNTKLDSKGTTHKQRKILVNIPYKDQWFVPGQESYLTTLFKDAGGEILGAKAGSSVSGQISVETAYSLSKEADLWMNVGWCQTLEQLLSVNPLFDDFLMDIQGNASARGYSNAEGCATNSSDTSASVVWNDNNRLNPKGGNDFWESGVVRPDLLLRDLIGIFSGEYGHAIIYYKSIK